MKKIFLITIALLLSTANVFAATYDMKYTNTECLADGLTYATVDVTTNTCTDITITVNEGAFTKGPNFGMQEFGFNYTGTISTITSSDPGFIISANGQMDGFGRFDQVATAKGFSRATSLTITVCGTAIVIEGCFAAHIADFIIAPQTGNYCDKCVTSGFFGSCAPRGKESAPTEPCVTLISLSSFTAKASNGRVKLDWVTESEIDNAGFNVWRAEAEDGKYVKLNDEIIPAKGSASNGAKYVFTDNIAKNRKTYFYKLEDVDLAEVSTFHGPVSATPRLILGLF